MTLNLCGQRWVKEEMDRFSRVEVGGEGETEGNVSQEESRGSSPPSTSSPIRQHTTSKILML